MASLSLASTRKMVSGYEIPVIGFGSYQTPPDVTEKVILKALEAGYRHVDCAQLYQNEAECAAAIYNSGIERAKIFYTTKIPDSHMSYEKAKEAIEASLSAASCLGYIDLVLLHTPYGGKEGRLGAWRALVEAQKTRKIRSIGVSNYGIRHLEELEHYIRTSGVGGQISVAQYEIHPWCAREDIVAWLKKRDIVVEAYSPLVQAKRMNEPMLQSLAKKYKKSPAQILVRWSLQKGYVPLPKSVTDFRIKENTQVFDFELSQEDMRQLQTDEHAPVCWDLARDSKL
ncbi:aldo/keto reductase family protein [Aspergillus saccharolyticus JOP 1030-1]|uniref:D-xylose reductase [NAD(P)H] n=1 Tax=Aspergillus saccharolyticus JOP 1030-1 TaxID=1450539 RepID=A0A318ZBT8_9EURO|nr:aldo-keto reductase [Aspergillus saccharolyticus JOP 1030-1]PYH40940.1 aldo-keto reductase [Aspergillus saccharolyticus JOP 1030-1]